MDPMELQVAADLLEENGFDGPARLLRQEAEQRQPGYSNWPEPYIAVDMEGRTERIGSPYYHLAKPSTRWVEGEIQCYPVPDYDMAKRPAIPESEFKAIDRFLSAYHFRLRPVEPQQHFRRRA